MNNLAICRQDPRFSPQSRIQIFRSIKNNIAQLCTIKEAILAIHTLETIKIYISKIAQEYMSPGTIIGMSNLETML